MKIVGLTGKADSGKSHIAREVLAKRGEYLPLSLAGPMKSALAAQGVIPAEEAIGQAPKSERTRRTLQVYGTELGRDRYHEEVWCANLEWWISWFMSEADIHNFVIPDIRFENELRWIEALGGVVIRVVGRGGLDGAAGDHPSETALDGVVIPEVNNSQDANLPVVAEQVRTIIADHYEANPEPQPYEY